MREAQWELNTERGRKGAERKRTQSVHEENTNGSFYLSSHAILHNYISTCRPKARRKPGPSILSLNIPSIGNSRIITPTTRTARTIILDPYLHQVQEVMGASDHGQRKGKFWATAETATAPTHPDIKNRKFLRTTKLSSRDPKGGGAKTM